MVLPGKSAGVARECLRVTEFETSRPGLSGRKQGTYSQGMKSAFLPALLFLAAVPHAEAAGIPVQPLAPITLHGHTNALLLQNRLIEVVLYPSLGRVGAINFRGQPNVLRFDERLAETMAAPDATRPDGWLNYGGDWIWPVAQAHWAEHFGAAWPPPGFMDGQPWSGHAWVNDDQSQTAVLELHIGAPLHISIQRKFTLPPDSATVTVLQRITRTDTSAVPVTLWNISQIAGAERVALAVETNSAFAGGFRVLDFAPPAPEWLHREEPSVLVVDTRLAPEIKIGSDSPRGWMGAQRGDVLLMERASGRPDATTFPDGGCRTELYSNSGLGYTEIETLSEERVLQPGETLENTLTMALHHVPRALDHTAFALRVLETVGERTPPPVTAP